MELPKKLSVPKKLLELVPTSQPHHCWQDEFFAQHHQRAYLDSTPSLYIKRCLCHMLMKLQEQMCTHTHTHVLWPSSILSGTTWVSWHQKGKMRKVKPIWIYWSKR